MPLLEYFGDESEQNQKGFFLLNTKIERLFDLLR